MNVHNVCTNTFRRRSTGTSCHQILQAMSQRTCITTSCCPFRRANRSVHSTRPHNRRVRGRADSQRMSGDIHPHAPARHCRTTHRESFCEVAALRMRPGTPAKHVIARNVTPALARGAALGSGSRCDCVKHACGARHAVLFALRARPRAHRRNARVARHSAAARTIVCHSGGALCNKRQEHE
jgi:hypothetical protein